LGAVGALVGREIRRFFENSEKTRAGVPEITESAVK
jgi:hypothetical protein